jgi:hypothetical protein
MKSQGILLLVVSLSIGVAAPSAARPGHAAWPGQVGGLAHRGGAWDCLTFPFLRLTAEWGYQELEATAVDGPGSSDAGTDIWRKNGLIVPDGCNTLFVTIVAHGETGNDAAAQLTDAPDLLLGCKLDFSPSAGTRDCAADDDGLYELHPIKVISDVGSNTTSDINIHYTWCAVVTPGTYDLAISLGTGETSVPLTGAREVTLKDAYFYVDAAFVEQGACVRGSEPAGVSDGT